MATIDGQGGSGEANGSGVAGRFGARLAGVGRMLADLVVPPRCLSCQRPLASHDALCAPCWRQIRFIRAPLCERLGIPLPFDTGSPTVSGAALADPPNWDRARAVAEFGPVIRTLIHGFKYADRHEGLRLFGRWLSEAGRELLADADLLVPVPLHRLRLLSRKFNQAGLLAQEAARLSGVPADPFALRRRKPTPAQVQLSRAERRRNLAGAFEVADHTRVEGRRIVLIDDVMTTGSTASACASALRRAGAERIDVLALAMVINSGAVGGGMVLDARQ